MADRPDLERCGWPMLSWLMFADQPEQLRAAGSPWAAVAAAVEGTMAVLEDGQRKLAEAWRSPAGTAYLAELGRVVEVMRATVRAARHNDQVMTAAAESLDDRQKDFAVLATAPIPEDARQRYGRAMVKALDESYHQAIAGFHEVPVPHRDDPGGQPSAHGTAPRDSRELPSWVPSQPGEQHGQVKLERGAAGPSPDAGRAPAPGALAGGTPAPGGPASGAPAPGSSLGSVPAPGSSAGSGPAPGREAAGGPVLSSAAGGSPLPGARAPGTGAAPGGVDRVPAIQQAQQATQPAGWPVTQLPPNGAPWLHRPPGPAHRSGAAAGRPAGADAVVGGDRPAGQRRGTEPAGTSGVPGTGSPAGRGSDPPDGYRRPGQPFPASRHRAVPSTIQPAPPAQPAPPTQPAPGRGTPARRPSPPSGRRGQAEAVTEYVDDLGNRITIRRPR